MTKKFDVVIGNPPYQDEAVGGATSAPPIYPQFMDAAYEIGSKAVLITPARFLFNAGYTTKTWNQKMLDDKHLSVPVYVPNSNTLFPGTDIKGGVAVTYRDSEQNLGPLGVFTKHEELTSIMRKVTSFGGTSFASLVTKRDAYKYTHKMHEEHPEASEAMSHSAQHIVIANAFEKLPFLFTAGKPDSSDKYVRIMGLSGNKREIRWVRRDFITGPKSFEHFKVAVAKANGSGNFGEALSTPVVLEPQVATTQTFLTVGSFEKSEEASACLNYIRTKFARALLGVLKITQDNPSRVWEHVPAQDFSSESDIDWSKSIPEIDQQLYKKYNLSASEMDFIETNVKAMS
ncbi:Eco57I restriction-modification methylase domain-containing protein [Leucobacter sp. UCMA 4100]|uniref:Eco57I restriction-modification methylase domain-containing protein n=1 Tax=Leucobacter sp. UCMA 4100 TaxID=2810534 RepID=UPI0022EB7165|nr:Eco57I restriction-modification methylase domain-containing protein [Leucobacter sp. UCMA 4100]MDA3145846.1 Eco57I restriction-modification methylase domain-containing protein [Leucobacter sp. UCMA 4100]MDA3146903.1 Eco57I restriction-modification methylase domain-containing protein [Leucobacter sp. UCMA 4100]